MVNGCPEEYFLTILHVKSADAEEITRALTTYISDKELEYTKLVGQGYDGASAFSGVHSGVNESTCSSCSLHPLLMSQVAACFYASS